MKRTYSNLVILGLVLAIGACGKVDRTIVKPIVPSPPSVPPSPPSIPPSPPSNPPSGSIFLESSSKISDKNLSFKTLTNSETAVLELNLLFEAANKLKIDAARLSIKQFGQSTIPASDISKGNSKLASDEDEDVKISVSVTDSQEFKVVAQLAPAGDPSTYLVGKGSSPEGKSFKPSGHLQAKVEGEGLKDAYSFEGLGKDLPVSSPAIAVKKDTVPSGESPEADDYFTGLITLSPNGLSSEFDVWKAPEQSGDDVMKADAEGCFLKAEITPLGGAGLKPYTLLIYGIEKLKDVREAIKAQASKASLIPGKSTSAWLVCDTAMTNGKNKMIGKGLDKGLIYMAHTFTLLPGGVEVKTKDDAATASR